MKEGALILADCLGFRGIWNRMDPAKLIKKLQAFETEAMTRIVPQYSSSMLSFGAIRFHLRFLSDTVVMSIQYDDKAYESGEKPDERQKNLLASVACQCAASLANLFVDSEMPLPLRGCISFGHHLAESNFLIGPAVDQAAEYMNEPEGAFIWVLPEVAERHKGFRAQALKFFDVPDDVILSAIAKLTPQAEHLKELDKKPEFETKRFVEALRLTYTQILAVPTVIEDYPLPLKRGSNLNAAVINPLLSGPNEQERKRVIGLYEQFLQGDRIDIWTKRQNTLKFLQVADKATETFRNALGSGEYP